MGIISSKPKQNLIINGDMRIAQRGTSFSAIATNVYSLDRWQYVKSGSMVHTVSQSSDAPTDVQSGYQFTNSLDATVTTAQASIGVNDENFLRQSIEGFNFTQIARQKPFTISFWVKSTVTGTYCVSLRNSGNDRSYIAEYSVLSSNTWEYKTITVSSPTPSAGTWDYTNGIGLQVLFVMAAGTNRQTVAGSWQTGNFIASSNQVNAVGTISNVFRITGVMVNESNYGQQFKTFGNSFDDEVIACQRYYEKSYNLNVNPGTNTSEGVKAGAIGISVPNAATLDLGIPYKTTKRANPSGVVYAPQGNAGAINVAGAIRGGTVGIPSQNGFYYVLNTSGVTWNVGEGYAFHFTADAEL